MFTAPLDGIVLRDIFVFFFEKSFPNSLCVEGNCGTGFSIAEHSFRLWMVNNWNNRIFYFVRRSYLVPTDLIPSHFVVSNHSQTIGLILIIPMVFPRYLYSLIKVYEKIVSTFSIFRVNYSRSWQNVVTKFVGTKWVGT